MFKHVFADVATASKQLRRNIESAKKRAFYLPEYSPHPYSLLIFHAPSCFRPSSVHRVRDRSNPGPFTLPHPFGVVGLLSSEEKAAFGYERVIRISFTNPEQPWLDMDSSPFTIKAYANWKSDLEQLLSSKGHWIYPIMIPTKVPLLSFLFQVALLTLCLTCSGPLQEQAGTSGLRSFCPGLHQWG